MSQSPVSPQRRRFFLSIILSVVTAVLGGLSAWSLWRFLAPAAVGGKDDKLSLDRSLVPLGQAHLVNFRGRPTVVLQPTSGRFLAFEAVCTHLGCIVKWVPEKGEMLCPCHGGRFSVEGTVLGGPPPKPLKAVALTLQGEKLVLG